MRWAVGVVLVVLLFALILSACATAEGVQKGSGPSTAGISYFYDQVHKVSCYESVRGLSCLRDVPDGAFPSRWFEVGK